MYRYLRKIKGREEIIELLNKEKKRGKKIVFTNGCFDILHLGHIHLLEEAKKHGDLLIVGLNSDSSIKSIKGDTRPILNQEARAAILASLEVVDYIVIFDEETPYSLISLIKPDVLVKGGDYKEEEVVGQDIVKANKGEVIIVPLVGNWSTSSILSILERIILAE